jgi:predicted DCC family thiol-disulfide oxidoreductase YuxK
MTAAPRRPVILYDSDCAFCRWSVDKVLAWDRRRRLRAVAIQGAEADELLSEIPEAERLASWHFVAADGRRYSAGAAAAPLLRQLPFGSPLAAVLSAFPALTDRAYRLVARNRDWFARRVGETACAVDPARRNRN